MASSKALRDWCSVTCSSYPNVEIKNMSTSFRDGLAFCAIIHKHRPDLIDFSSLSKNNAYQNNKLVSDFLLLYVCTQAKHTTIQADSLISAFEAFEVAETKLGIPALLDPQDMVLTSVPDCLSVISYLSQYYYFFNRKSYAGLTSVRSSHVSVLNNLTKSNGADGLKARKSSTDLETSREDRLSSTRPRTVCHLCLKPIHLIQRHLIDGKVYHRNCFRCEVCHSTLLPGSYTKGSSAGSLICTHHTADGKNTCPDLSQQTGSTENQPNCKFQAGFFSLSGLAITTVPHYAKKTESQDRLVCKRPEAEGNREVRDRENRDCSVGINCREKKPVPPHLPTPVAEDSAEKAGPAPTEADRKIQQGETKTQEPSELSSPCAKKTEETSRPVPAPRRMSGSPLVPVPAPRTKNSQTMNSCPAAGNSPSQSKSSSSSPHNNSPTSGSSRVKTNHPWLAIIHPGPWTQLPPAQAPVPTPRSKLQRSRCRPRAPAPNPFEEDVDEAAACSENGGNPGGVTNTVSTLSEPAGDSRQIGLSDLGETGNTGGSPAEVAETAGGPHAISDEPQSHILPRSLSVPAVTSDQSAFLPADSSEANECDQVTSCESKPVCKENPFDRKPAMPKSKTFQDLPSRRAPAPGHGFPLIKRKVQTDQNVSTEDLQVEMSKLEKQLREIEQRGVELESNLRNSKNDKEEEQMLLEWFSLIHERHVLVCRDAELVYLKKQQKLEERQADVEYELRCLLNKPETDWSQEDRDLEQKLMDELVAIIEQRNQIISSLDQDRQREREEDLLLETMMKKNEFPKEKLKELKKSKGKFKPSKVFKMLNQKAESTKDSMDKKN